jgi:elongation factor P--(R)-beta-lysine ligase
MNESALKNKATILRDRANMFEEIRAFFKIRAVLEVDCCSLVRCPALDANIDVMHTFVTDRETGYLHTSPEYAMKRLLSNGLGDIYYMGHVFRRGEVGRLHNPEFTMIEWYRTTVSYRDFINETCELIMLLIGQYPIRILSYREAFQTYIGIDPFANVDLPQAARRLGIETPPASAQWDRDTWLQLLLSHAVEPKLGQGELTVLCEYPPSQAALARVIEKDGIPIAERFEIYFSGIELSNGYHELSDATEQRRRFEEENRNRQSIGKEPYAIDESFLAALKRGLPDSCGVSVGFDRLMIIRHKAQALCDVLPFAWDKL